MEGNVVTRDSKKQRECFWERESWSRNYLTTWFHSWIILLPCGHSTAQWQLWQCTETRHLPVIELTEGFSLLSGVQSNTITFHRCEGFLQCDSCYSCLLICCMYIKSWFITSCLYILWFRFCTRVSYLFTILRNVSSCIILSLGHFFWLNT